MFNEDSSVVVAPGRFPIVGVGASAGGLEALNDLFRHLSDLPVTPGMAFVVVSHLDPHHASFLPEILARNTSLQVTVVADGVTVEKGWVYVIPPNTRLEISGGRLTLSPRNQVLGPFMPIDHFFRSLAQDQGHMAIGVILSGNGTDGTHGLEDIKAADGVVLVQDEKTAQHGAMPRSAISSGCADFVLSPTAIAHELDRLNREYFHCATPPAIVQFSGDGEALQKIFELLRNTLGVDFTDYKRTTIHRRVYRRMGLSGVDTLQDYLTALKDCPSELKALHRDLLIRVTSFFRDPAAFQALARLAFPTFVNNHAPDSSIRIWVAGCSTGEEVYSVAIALLEFLGDMVSNTSIKILATDVDEIALERARAGIFGDKIALDVSSGRLRRFFTKVDGGYQICKSIRDLCIFSKHNVAWDMPFANLDLVCCRNLLIYLDQPLQNRVLPCFHYALQPTGVLMLGTAETIGAHCNLFDALDLENRLFTKRNIRIKMTNDFPPLGNRPFIPRDPGPLPHVAVPLQPKNVLNEADRVLLNHYVPPSVVIDDKLAILQFRGEIGRYLHPSSGTASLQLLKMVNEGLTADLVTAIDRAKTGNMAIRREVLSLDNGGQSGPFAFEVVPLRHEAGPPRFFLVLFEDLPQPPAAGVSPSSASGAPLDLEVRLRQVERELASAREYLQIVDRQNEANNEELKVANEEILSSNEELQSTNEELQTVKEEMQSANEELTTTNQELNHRNRELGHLIDDLTNLLDGLDIPIIILDRELRIRRFTPPAGVLFNVIATDLGRRISDLRSNLDVPNLDVLIMEVINTRTFLERNVRDNRGHWHSLRIRPYITADKKVDGAALAVVDIEAARIAAEQPKA